MQDERGIVERLRATYTMPTNRTVQTVTAGPMVSTVAARPVVYRNPDGPQAADLIEQQAREIERLRAGWQPIETAPRDAHILLYANIPPVKDRDGLVLLGYEVPQVVTGYWDAMDEAWCTTVSTVFGPFVSPTHWQPLPSPPTDTPAP